MARRAAKVDANHSTIAAEFEALGCTVTSLAMVGAGCPDLLVGVEKLNLVVEVKNPALPVSERRLTGPQKIWHRDWRGTAYVIETVEQVKLVVDNARAMAKALASALK